MITRINITGQTVTVRGKDLPAGRVLIDDGRPEVLVRWDDGRHTTERPGDLEVQR